MRTEAKIQTQVIADEAVRHLASHEPLQSIFPIKCEAKVWTAVATGEVTLIVSAYPKVDFSLGLPIREARRIAGRAQNAFTCEPITRPDVEVSGVRELATTMYEKLKPMAESIRAYFYCDMWC